MKAKMPTQQKRKMGPYPRAVTLPCVRCGNPGGYIARHNVTPARYHGGQFGIVGDLCHICYNALLIRRKFMTHSPRTPHDMMLPATVMAFIAALEDSNTDGTVVAQRLAAMKKLAMTILRSRALNGEGDAIGIAEVEEP